jgi:DNA-binding transcriptional MocR family regulator
VDTDGEGIIPAKLEAVLQEWTSSDKPRVLYTIPTGQNPSGATASLERKQQIYTIASKHNILIIGMLMIPYYM